MRNIDIKKYPCLFLLLLMLALSADAQELAVESFDDEGRNVMGDLRRKDLNGDYCALIKVVLPEDKAAFEGDIVGDYVYKGGEYWVYLVSTYTKKFRVAYAGCVPITITFADYGIEKLRADGIYRLTFDKDKLRGVVMQTLTVRVSPADAMLFIDTKMYNADSGVLTLNLPVGEHEYMVAAKGYKSADGIIRLREGGNNTLHVDLDKEEEPEDSKTASSSEKFPSPTTATEAESPIVIETTKSEEEGKTDISVKTPDTSGIDTINGHEYVDLGLSVKWATCNVGAKGIYDGDQYRWGDAYKSGDKDYKKKDCYTWKRYMEDYTGYWRFDVATEKWGYPWRTPTKEELKELFDNCIFEYKSKGIHTGILFTSKINGKTIFLPTGRCTVPKGYEHTESVSGWYWSSTPAPDDTEKAYLLWFVCQTGQGATIHFGDTYRYFGCYVRPVAD